MTKKTGIGVREYARRRGVSHTAVGKAIRDGRITVEPDGSIDPAKADQQWDAQTNPAMRRGAAAHASAASVASLTRAATKAVPAAALAAVDEALKDVDPIAPPKTGEPANPEAGTFLRARNANEVLRAQTAQLRLKKLAGDLVDRQKATGMIFELARRERDAWQNWPPRVAANMAAELGVDAHKMELALDKFIRIQLAELAEITLDLR